MVTRTSSQMQRYGVAVLAVVSALLLMLLLNPWVAMTQSPFVMFFGAVMVSAWYGGTKPGVLATLSSALLSAYFFFYPTYSLTFNLTNSVRLSLFVLEGLLISVLCGALRTTNQRFEVSLRKLRSSEERYRRLMDTAYEGIWTLDTEGRITYLNQQIAQMLGYSIKEMLDRPVFDLMDEESRSQAKQNLERCKQGIKEQFDFRFCRKDGSPLWAIVSTNPIFSETGEFQGAIAMITDISDRLAAEEALRQSEERFRLAIDNFPDAFAIYDANRRFRYVNARGLELTGKSLEEFLGHTDEEIWSREVTDGYLPLLLRAVETLTPQSAECNITLPDAGKFTMIVKYVPLLDESGTIYSILGITYDITERKQLEDELRQSEARVRRLIDSNMIGVIFADFSGKITEANDAFLEIVGYTQDDLLAGKLYWSEMTSPEYFAVDQRALEEIRKTGACAPFEKEYIRKDGTRVPILLGAAHLRESQDDCVCFILDLSDRKRAEEALRQSEERFRRLFDSNMIGIAFWNVDGFITDANDAYLRLAGYTREEFTQLGKIDWRGLTPPQYKDLDDRAIQETLVTRVSNVYEKEYVHRDGQRVPILLGVALLNDSQHDGVAFVLDISDRKQAEAALRESEARFRQMADTAPVLIWMSDPDKLCNYFNQGWLDFTGRTMEQELGNGWSEGVHPDDLQRCLDTYVNAFEARQEFKMEYRLRRFDGEYGWIFDIGVPRFTPDGSFLGYIGSCMDISDRKLAEAEIQQLNESLEQRVKERTAQLEAVNQELEAFSYSVSHDLRAPFRHISGFVELLEKDAGATLEATGQRYLNVIAQSAKQAGKLIDDLLAFSRMGRSQMRYTTVNLNQLVREVRQDIEPETKGRVIHWQIEDLPEVCGDPSMLRLVLSNLISNAVKYTAKRPQAEIAIASTHDEHEIVIFICDNGVGFDRRYVHKLFGVFQRLHSTQEFEGTGIGLANVRRIIQRHGGRTWAEGEIDKGATFYFSLPLVDKELKVE